MKNGAVIGSVQLRRHFRVSAPGRVCLFGEHSDYLSLNVITAAIDLGINMDVHTRPDDLIRIRYLDLNENDEFRIGMPASYRRKRDYVRGAFNVLLLEGIVPLRGADIEIRGNIPMNSGLASSSALTVAAVLTGAALSGRTLDRKTIVKYAFRAEVLEFGESGGSMDHTACTYGNIVHVDCGPQPQVTELPAGIHGLVIGDSREKKRDTVGDLRKIRGTVEQGYTALRNIIDGFDQRTTPLTEVMRHASSLPADVRRMTLTTLRNRDLTARAFALLRSPTPDPRTLGQMIDEHHALMRDGLDRSTPKIERLIDAAKEAGALGCKINGSGGGGTILAYAPGRETEVMRAIEKEGGTPYLVRVVGGAAVVR
ncbi:MAG: mevalonate kinase family protein [Candidatus Thorarchaeota archaeon]